MKEKAGSLSISGFTYSEGNISETLRKIGLEREKKGAAKSLIPIIDDVRSQAVKAQDFTSATVLYQEKLLCAQHIIMENRRNPAKIVEGLSIMVPTSKEMIEFQKKHEDKIDPIVAARSFRFLGRQADLFHQYGKSEKYYRQCLQYFEGLEPIEQRYNRLELSGFLSYSLLKQRKPGWFDLTQKTLSEFDTSEEGKWLKDNDYYPWAVWKSGIEIRTSDEVLGSKKLRSQYRVNVGEWLGDAESILRMPDGDTEVFGIRRQELSEVTQKSRRMKLD